MVQPKQTPERKAFYQRIDSHDLAPLWEVLHGLISPEPRSPCAPALWRYRDIRPFVMESGELITAAEAERRVLVLENPGLRGRASITHTLYAGLQLILPGERAPCHRHSQSALRFVVEGEGAHTAVDGEKTLMRPGDFVITPSGTAHDHGNDSERAMVWLDGLDIPLVQFLDASFAEGFGGEPQRLTRPVGDALARYGSGLLPVDYQARGPTSPVFNYPYARTREALETMRRREEWDPCHGLKMRYVNPVDGGYAMPTIGAFIQLLPPGFETLPYRSTDGTVYAVVEGSGATQVGDQTFTWEAHDVFVVPSWTWHHHRAEGDAVLFSYSDRPVHQKLGLWREQRGNALTP
ncbi:MAG: gentisate 1,2-dioxygenase [Gammaproteobacteria bacterium]|nr:gentisate 1,2-dioxygenase [Gammaproteobacteria bacterium]NIR84910.1 gentisate 1,2-dioxygenase [Gammaproteobacteria bacterium]NIR91759.1 gentisate 1,2-dioxygenase [Gammaproteobacteria bacterium]NIU05957.1 gentisate 1,2-dioxygenase [Gammaproteobacteria bacterium]NIV53004.1 gentisate 1,2-dioxygenase [Gammaproteobacteria bacterium]